MSEPDVIVVGGGPAGLAAAIVCATHGLATRMIERHSFPIDKPCGEGLLPNGVDALARVGLDPTSMSAHARRIVGIRYCTSQGQCAEVSFRGDTGLGMRRADLSRALLAHARRLSHLEIVTGHAAHTAVDDSGRPLVRQGGTICRPRLLIGADGLHSRIRDSVGIAVAHRGRNRWGCRQHFSGEPWTDRVEVHFERGYEVYVTPLADGVNVAVLWDARRVRVQTGRSPVLTLATRVPSLARRLEGRIPTDRPRAAGPFDVRVRQPWRTGVLLIGDAAGYVDPLTGEGVGAAFEQAALLSGTVIPALHRAPHKVVESGALAEFVRAARLQSRSNRLLTRLLVQVAKCPTLVNWVVAALASNAALFARLLDLNMGRCDPWRAVLPATKAQTR